MGLEHKNQPRRNGIALRRLVAGVLATIAVTIVTGDAATAVQPSRPRATGMDDVNEHMSLRASSLQPIVLDRQMDGSIRTQVELDGVRRTLSLRKHSLRGDGFRVLVQREPFGPLVPVEPPAAQTYRGTIDELPGAVVSASIAGGTITATIRTPDGIYGVQPADTLTTTAGPGEHVVFRSEDWIDREGVSCGAEDLMNTETRDTQASSGTIAATGLKVAEVAIDADVEFFQLNGSSVDATVLDIETVMDAVEAIYERDTAITYEVTTIVIRTVEPDPYDSANNSTILCEFRNAWNDAPETNIHRDVAHLFTGKNIDGSVIGTAWLSAVCNATGSTCGNAPPVRESLAYGFSESRFTSAMTSRVALTAHEIGHNWSAPHCNGDSDCHIMCSGLGGCAGLAGERLKFGSASTNSITNFRDTRTCLADLADPPTIPFFDDFSTGVIDSAKWSYFDGAVLTTIAENPPSPPYALNIDRAGSDPYDDDEIRSNTIPLGGSADIALSYHTQHHGVSANGALVVEYWNNNLTWREINRIVSDGVDQSTFSFHSHLLPDDANHSEFRLRFRTEVGSASEEWYVDDIGVGAACLTDDQCNDGLYCNGIELCIDGSCSSSTSPCAVGEICDEGHQSCVDPACEAPGATAAGGRYLAITPPPIAAAVALLIAPGCDSAAQRYIGIPTGPDHLATLVDPSEAPFLTPIEWNGAILVTDESIVPGTEYFVWTDCGSIGSPSLSPASVVSTRRFGDVVGAFVDGAWTAPDESVDVAIDVVAILEAFAGLPSAPPMAAADLIGVSVTGFVCSPDQSIDIQDITLALDAFRGATFTEATGCPNVACDAP